VLELEPGQYLAESDAILFFLAEGTLFWPQQRRARAEVLQWMFFEQYSHEPYIAVARFICTMLPAESCTPQRAAAPARARRAGARGHGAAPGAARVFGRRQLLDCRYRAVCLHARGR
jgi:glutathione S-transferase